MDWQIRREEVEPGRALRLRVDLGDTVASYREVLGGWREAPSLSDLFTETIRDPFEACFWETRPVTADTVDEPFECVVVNSPALARVTADATPFARQLHRAGPDGIAVFDNLGGDAQLVVPVARAPGDAFAHLATFLRSATPQQARALWAAVGSAVERRLEGRQAPLWVSTSGLGVYWVHVRLDDRPKYYTWTPYRRA